LLYLPFGKYKSEISITIQVYIEVLFIISGYDAHLFIKELGRKFNKEDIGVIAENKSTSALTYR